MRLAGASSPTSAPGRDEAHAALQRAAVPDTLACMPRVLSLPEARHLAIASQGFGARPASPNTRDIRKLAATIHALQIDSVNVLARAQYVPAYARLGPYPAAILDDLAYTKRELFEYWGHAACLIPVALHPLLRYRMHRNEALEYMASKRGAYTQRVYDEVADRGPLAASELTDPGKRSGKWWGWGNGKAALEYLFDSGLLAIAARRRFERLYDLAERVIPASVLNASAPPAEEAMKQLIVLGAQACGVGTGTDITGYFMVDGWHDRQPRIPPWERPPANGRSQRAKPIAKRLLAELVEEGRLLTCEVDGWSEPAYLHPAARVPRPAADASGDTPRALVTPFDSLVWERSRIDRLFGMKYTIEIYTPPEKRVYGYYVFPFLLGDTLVGRCDLKADRQRGVLLVKAAHLEPNQRASTVAPHLAAELRTMQRWLALDGIDVTPHGDLAPALRRALTAKPAN